MFRGEGGGGRKKKEVLGIEATARISRPVSFLVWFGILQPRLGSVYT